MGSFDAPRLIRHDMRRTAEVLEVAASGIGDEFLQYLFGMAILHLDEKAGNGQPVEVLPLNDPQIAMVAKLVSSQG
jgi:hypothetical protein